MNDTDQRAALRAAIAEREVKREALRLTQQAEGRCIGLLQEAASKLESFGNIDADIVEHRAGKFKHAAVGAGPAPDIRLPDALAKRRRERDEARDVLVAARAAADSLSAERAQAEKALQQAERRASEQAAAILLEEATAQGATLLATWQALWNAVDQLNALRGSWLPTPVRLPPAVVRMLRYLAQQDHRQFPGNLNSGITRAGARWKRYHESLCRDADAEIPELVDAASSSTERVA